MCVAVCCSVLQCVAVCCSVFCLAGAYVCVVGVCVHVPVCLRLYSCPITNGFKYSSTHAQHTATHAATHTAMHTATRCNTY